MIFRDWNLTIFTGPILTLPKPTPLKSPFYLEILKFRLIKVKINALNQHQIFWKTVNIEAKLLNQASGRI